MKNNNIVPFMLMQYRRMWKEDRWKFSGEMVKLTIKQNRFGLTDEEQYKMDIINQVVEENDGKWLDGYDVSRISRTR
jgi:hypothetical protein